MNKDFLRERWLTILSVESSYRSGYTEKYEDLLGKIFKFYEDDKRFYHTIEHVEHMLSKINESIKDYVYEYGYIIAELATFFHDIYYDPANINKNPSNEFLSSVIARRELHSINVEEKTICDVENLIRLTETHKVNTQLSIPNYIQEIFLDADMAILGETSEMYREYSDNIAKEYLNVVPNAAVYYTKRKEFLSKTLENKNIFYTCGWPGGYFGVKSEAQARLNMKNEIVRLDKLLAEETK